MTSFRWAKATDVVLRRSVKIGTLRVEADGGEEIYRGSADGPAATITLNRPDAVAREVLRGGGLGFADSYIRGDWDSPDLARLLELAARNLDDRRRSKTGTSSIRSARTVWARLRRRSPAPAVRTMIEHYDLGNDFYAAWLDPSMSYSSGIFTGDADLEDAMRTKYERLAERCGIQRGERVLEIGCGWGAMAEYVARELDCSVTAVTISQEQYDYVTQRMSRGGLADKVEVVLADFREIDGRYDRIVSIEMIESIDEESWAELFDVMARSLKPGGTAALQVITIADDLHRQMIGRDDFIRTYIFPGGALPSTEVLRRLGDDAGLEWDGLSTHGRSYARTLAEWDRRFVAAWQEVEGEGERFDEAFYRMWRYYFAYCEAGFQTGRLDGVQVVYRRPGPESA